MLIRHAEKPDRDFAPYGVTLLGERSSESLDVRGWQRSGALANFFAPADNRFQHASLARPQFLYASKPLRRKGSRRPLETLTPLATKLGIQIKSSFPRYEFVEMVEEVFSRKGVVLICWQREYIPQIALHILGRKIAPSDWPVNRFDMVWVFDLDHSASRYTFKQIPQRLLHGDSTRLIR